MPAAGMVVKAEDVLWAHSNRSGILSFFISKRHSLLEGILEFAQFPRRIFDDVTEGAVGSKLDYSGEQCYVNEVRS